MVKIEEIYEGDRKFVFEPPVEVGDHTVDSLAKLAAIAAVGYGADMRSIDQLTDETNHVLGLLDPDNFDQYISNVASRGLKKHFVYVSKY
jgi:hypothetical protein